MKRCTDFRAAVDEQIVRLAADLFIAEEQHQALAHRLREAGDGHQLADAARLSTEILSVQAIIGDQVRRLATLRACSLRAVRARAAVAHHLCPLPHRPNDPARLLHVLAADVLCLDPAAWWTTDQLTAVIPAARGQAA